MCLNSAKTCAEIENNQWRKQTKEIANKISRKRRITSASKSMPEVIYLLVDFSMFPFWTEATATFRPNHFTPMQNAKNMLKTK